MSKRKTKNKVETETTYPSTSETVETNTVRSKRALYQKTANLFQVAGNEMLQLGVRNLNAGVREIQVEIFEKQVLTKEQIKKFKEGVAKMVLGIVEMRKSFAKQVIENQEYTKQFYG